MVQREVGSLAELLNKLADIIRDRFRIERLIKSLTGQNRMSAWTVCSIPPFLAVFMFIREPEMMNDMLNDPMGRAMLAGAVFRNPWNHRFPKAYQSSHLSEVLWKY